MKSPPPAGAAVTGGAGPARHAATVRLEINLFQDIVHVSFGGGNHFCLGAHLARVEAQEAVGALVARYPNLRAAGKETWKQVPGFRGLSEFTISID